MTNKIEQEWVKDLIREAFSQENSYESQFHYKKYDVLKKVFDTNTQTFKEQKIAFNVPLREAEIIQNSQKPKTIFDNGEITFLVSYEIKEAE